MLQSRETDKIRGQVSILERRIQILQDEKNVLTTMERRLQERCAELQREVFRLQGAHNSDGYKSLEKQPVALPRQVLPGANKNDSSEHEDEGISSSETGQSLSPEPLLIMSQNSKKHDEDTITADYNTNNGNSKSFDSNTTIEEVIEELENIVHDAEQEAQESKVDFGKVLNPMDAYQMETKFKFVRDTNQYERDIVPVNLLPQPPKKSRSLSYLLSNASDFDESEYCTMLGNETRVSYYDDIDIEIENSRKHGYRVEPDGEANPDLINQTSTNRELLNVIMNARDDDENIFMAVPDHFANANNTEQSLIPKSLQTPQKFNGVFFMTEMSTPAKYPKPDITAALEARRVSKSIERLESYGNGGLDAMIDIIMTNERKQEMQNLISKAPNNFAALREMAMNATFSMRAESPVQDRSQSTDIPFSGMRISRSPHKIRGSKLCDLPSGLY